MKGFATSPNPWETGLRPRRFLSERVSMLKFEKLYKPIDYNKADKKQPKRAA